MLRRSLLALLLPAALLAPPAAAPAVAAERVADAGGVRIVLDGREVRLRAPSGMPRGAAIEVSCGRSTLAGIEIGRARATVRARQRLRLRLSRAVPHAEWCGYVVRIDGDGGSTAEFPGAGALRPGAIAPPAPLTAQTPGVRTGVTTDTDELDGSTLEGDEGDATFFAAGSVLTVRLREPLPRSTVVTLVCGSAHEPLGIRGLAVQRGRRAITADVGGDVSGAVWCLIEDELRGGDIAVAVLQPSGAVPPQVPSAP